MRVALTAPPWDHMVNPYPPLGLGYLSAMLTQAGIDNEIFDFGLTPTKTLEECATEIMEYKPDLVGISAWTHLYHKTLELSDHCQRIGGAKTFLGGPHASVFRKQILGESNVDFVIFGEGEETIVELVEAYEGKKNYKDVLGLVYRDDEGNICQNGDRGFINPMDRIPAPDRNKLKVTAYPLMYEDKHPMTTILTSRGCPFSCIYCYKGTFGNKIRGHSAEYVVQEIKDVVENYGIDHIYFVDDLFVYSRKRIKEMIDAIKKARLDIKWVCLGRVDIQKEEDYAMMAEGGCVEIHLGIESGSEAIMQSVDKHINKEQVANAVKWANAAGIKTKGYFMTGLPGDTEETIRQTMDFAANLGLEEAMFSLTTPLPGTKLWEIVNERKPELNDKEEFRKAFYFFSKDTAREYNPFCNVSEVNDRKLVELTQEASTVFWKRNKRRREFKKKYGSLMGEAVWRASMLTDVKWIGNTKRALTRSSGR